MIVTTTHRTLLYDVKYDPSATYKNSLTKKKSYPLNGGAICCSGEFLVTKEDIKVSISTFFRSGEYKKFQYQKKQKMFFQPSAIAETKDFLALVISSNRVRIGNRVQNPPIFFRSGAERWSGSRKNQWSGAERWSGSLVKIWSGAERWSGNFRKFRFFWCFT